MAQLKDLHACFCGKPKHETCDAVHCVAKQTVLVAHIKHRCSLCNASYGTTCTKGDCPNVVPWEGPLEIEQPPKLVPL